MHWDADSPLHACIAGNGFSFDREACRKRRPGENGRVAILFHPLQVT